MHLKSNQSIDGLIKYLMVEVLKWLDFCTFAPFVHLTIDDYETSFDWNVTTYLRL